MTLIKTSLLNGIAVVIKMLTMLGINKVLAIYIGPAGYAALGQFQNAVQMITTFASGAINTGVTKYTAEFGEDEAKQHKVWRTAGTIAIIGALITASFILIFNQSLAAWFLKDASLGSVFIWFAGTLIFFVFNTLLLAVLNGKKAIALYVTANIAGSIFSLLVTFFMVIKFGLYGALVALAIYQSLSFFVTFLLCSRAPWFKIKYLFGGIDPETAGKLLRYTLMALVSAACFPMSIILTRAYVGETFGWDFAGYWEAMLRLSAAYLLLVNTTLSVYYLPRLSELKDRLSVKREIIQGYKIILPIAVISGMAIYLLRDFLISLLFSPEFSSMRVLFFWQIMGDTLKIAGFILSYVMLSKAMVKLYIASEIIFSVLFYCLVVFLAPHFGFVAVSIAYLLTYFIYFIFLWFTIFLRNKSY